MGPQRSTAAVIAAGFAVIAAVIVVALVALQPRGEKSKASIAASEVGMPATIDETDVIEVLVVQDEIPPGTTLTAAMQGGYVGATAIPAEMAPQDFLDSLSPDPDVVLASKLPPGTVLSASNTKASSPVAPVPTDVDCPTDWTGSVPSGRRLVFVVSAPISQGTTVAQAFANGSIRPYSVSTKYAPAVAVAALAPICTRSAAVDLRRGTVLITGTFA